MTLSTGRSIADMFAASRGITMGQRFAQWLANEMERRRLSTTGLAALMGVHHTSIHFWLAGETEPRPKNIRRLADVLEVSPAEVYLALGRIPPIDKDHPDEVQRLIRLLDRIDPAHYELAEALLKQLPQRKAKGQPGEDTEDQPPE